MQNILSDRYGKAVVIETVVPLAGGCINKTAKIKTSEGVFFAKWNHLNKFPGMLETEGKGLQLLAKANEITVPLLIVGKNSDNKQYLILEFIESAPQKKNFWSEFGTSLAKLHKHTSERFGLDHDNYIGSLPQNNRWHDSWKDFFVLERLEPQIKRARDAGKIENSIIQKFSRLFSKLENIFPPEKPCLLHGDLWSGNYLTGRHGEPVLIDPAVYYGHREMDIGMTQLFGGFDPEFYSAYMEEFPLENDWQKRTDICNLYPLMVHVNLFGGGYVLQVESILRRF